MDREFLGEEDGHCSARITKRRQDLVPEHHLCTRSHLVAG